jgi:uncharacterized protein (TIGR03435 family)
VGAIRIRTGAAITLMCLFRLGAQPAPARIEFEVAAIHEANAGRSTEGAMASTRVANNRLEVRGFTLKALVKMAYSLQDYQIIGGPKWFDSDRYDIDAKLPADAVTQQIPERLQSLLTDRFQLVVHPETRSLPAYALVAAKGGAKLPRATDDAPQGFGWGPRMIRSKAALMQDLAQKLSAALQYPVLNQTGMSGLYQVDLKFAPVAPDPSDSNPGPSIFDAVQEQLGLRLEATKGPVDVMVVERAERLSAN